MTEQETIRSLQCDLTIAIRALDVSQARERRLREALERLVDFYDGNGVIAQPEYAIYKTLAELMAAARAALAGEAGERDADANQG